MWSNLFLLFLIIDNTRLLTNKNIRTFMLTSPNSKPVDQMDIFERFEKYSLERNPYMQRLYLNKILKNITINNESFSEIF
jgi:hypothetical protein